MKRCVLLASLFVAVTACSRSDCKPPSLPYSIDTVTNTVTCTNADERYDFGVSWVDTTTQPPKTYVCPAIICRWACRGCDHETAGLYFIDYGGPTGCQVPNKVPGFQLVDTPSEPDPRCG
jgi:hypothetical protein